MTKAQRHMGKVAQVGCIACILLGFGESPAQVHHIREERIARNDFLTIPLCREHHQGSRMSVHQNKRALMTALKMSSEFELLAETMMRMSCTS